MRLPKFLLRYQFGLTNRPSRFYDELVARYLKALDGRAALAPKIFTPKPIGSEVRQQQTIQFNRLIDRLMKLVRKWDEDDLDLYVIPHPLMGRLTFREILYFTIYHVQHHKKQVGTIIKRKMNLLKLKVFFLSPLLLLYVLSAKAQESYFDTMIDALISENVPVLSAEELQTKSNFILLDTRTKAEYDVSHIENAVWVGEKDWDLKSFKKFNKRQTVVVYCSVGYRSEKLVKKLLRLNFEKSFNLYGGVFDWINKGNPVENDHGVTDSIHGYDKSFARWIEKGVIVF